MGTQIPFPDDYQRHLRLGDKAVAEGNYLTAAKEYRLAYANNENLALVKKMIAVYMETQDFKAGLALAEFYAADFLSQPADFITYFRLLVLDRQYLTARKMVQVVAKKPAFDQDLLTDCLRELDQIEAVQPLMEPQLAEQKQLLLKSFNESGQPLGQNQWQTFTDNLSYPLFLDLASDCLERLQNAFLRPRLVEELLALGYAGQLPVVDLTGRLQKLDFSQLILPEKDPDLQRMTNYLEEHLSQLDPVMAAGLIQEMQTHFALAFPFNPQKEQPEAWAQSYLVDYQKMFGEARSEDQSAVQLAIQKQKEKLSLLLLGLNS